MKKSPRKPAPYDHAAIEKKWREKWLSSKIYKTSDKSGKKKYYVLDMFPYPSGEGLHVGHPKGYIATDVVSRMKRMQGMNVLHPMGFDAFGLPAENYAIKTKTNPEIAVKKNVAHFKKQLELIGLDYDWSREINTTDPAYYKWTQWIFLKLFEKGLAYQSHEPINWCPSCKTGLANEDVENGRCERCGTPVEKRSLRQWVLRITDYAERLLRDLDVTDYVMPRLIDKVNPHVPGAPLVRRRVAHAIVFDPKVKKYLIIRNKRFGWDTVVIGGVEDGENPVETARREVREETGYTDLEFKRILGGPTEAHYHAKHKGENRVAVAQAVLFELKSGARAPIKADSMTKDEASHNEVLWVDEKDFAPGKMVNSELPVWLERMKDPTKGFGKPLLDWPESIKEAQRNWIGRSEGAEIDFRLTIEKNKPRFVILHGYKGLPTKNFIPWLKSEFERLGHEVYAPELPNTETPTESEQVDYILKNCDLDENTVVVAHSLGCVSAMRALMKLNRRISGLLLVAPAKDPGFFHDHGRKPYHKDFKWDYDYGQLKRLANGKIAVLSDMQETTRAPYLKFLAEKLDAAFIETKAVREHFCAEKEPAVLECCTPKVKVFTTRPDTLFGVTYVVLSPEHHWIEGFMDRIENKAEVKAYIANTQRETEIERTDVEKEKTGVELKGIKAVNPANGEEVPVWIADYVLADYGTGAIMAVPAHDERDWEFAKKFGLPIKEVVIGGNVNNSAYLGDGKLINSKDFDGKDSESVKREITAFAGGRWTTRYKLRDWVFSRQRYWGEPIPIIHCEKCGAVPVPEKDLPVKLPKVKSYEPTGTGESPLAAISSWVNVKCPKCKGKARRETNTMPQWAGSCWYYLRYEDPKNKKALVDPKKETYWSPVDLYVGGAEHATRHLIYARFWHKFLNDIGVVSAAEPFTRLRPVGLIMGEDGRKMSKRFGNIVNPDDIVKTFGADSLRLYEMFMGPFDQSIAWSTGSIMGTRRFLERVWDLRQKISKVPATQADLFLSKKNVGVAVEKVTDDINGLRFNTAISALMIALNGLGQTQYVPKDCYEDFLKLLAPFAPHIAEELWNQLGNKNPIHLSDWPTSYDQKWIEEAVNTIILQINGKVRGSFVVPKEAGEEEVKRLAREAPEAQKWLGGKEIRRAIVVPGRLVNLVVVDR